MQIYSHSLIATRVSFSAQHLTLVTSTQRILLLSVTAFFRQGQFALCSDKDGEQTLLLEIKQ